MSTLTISARAYTNGHPSVRLVLPFELRQRSRLLTKLDSGEEVGLLMPRGTVLRGGDRLQDSNGRLVEVVAAPEELSVVRSQDGRQLARAAYHLGNRHVAVQITADSIRYAHDHVLDDMLRGQGLAVTFEMLPFEPEAGAYSTAGGHGHDHGHGHSHSHSHQHGHEHG